MHYCKNLRSKDATTQELEDLDVKHPLTRNKLVEYLNNYKFTNPTEKNMPHYEIKNGDGEAEPFWGYFLKNSIAGLK